MKRQELIRLVESLGCRLLREGSKHSVYFNPANNQTTAIPRDQHFPCAKDLQRFGCPGTVNDEPGF